MKDFNFMFKVFEFPKSFRDLVRIARLNNGEIVEYHVCDTDNQENAYDPEKFTLLGHGFIVSVDGKPFHYDNECTFFVRKENE